MFLPSNYLLYQVLPPRTRRRGRTGHTLRSSIYIGLAVLCLALPGLCEHSIVIATADNDEKPGSDFFHACSGGELETVVQSLLDHPDWVNASTDNGETCLHLTGIYGQTEITSLLLKKGANPNVRSTFDEGLRMHPLSWNVYGGHVGNIQLLLEHGADVNLDFDSMGKTAAPVTSLDILLELLKNEKGDERFQEIKILFDKYGAKTMEELNNGSGEL